MGLQDNRQFIAALGHVKPALAKHALIKNDIVRKFAMEHYGSIDILDQPMCTKCEKPCTWHKGGTAYHHECGTYIKKPITMLDYLTNEIKLTPKQLDEMGILMYTNKGLIMEGDK